MKKSILILLISFFIIAFFLYPYMPDEMVSHWDAQGNPDGYMLKFWGLFFIPFFSLGLYFLFYLIPKIDPLKENIEKFKNYYDKIIFITIGFIFYVYILSILWNLKFELDINIFIIPAFSALVFFIGDLLKSMKRNFFIGIRTPWTLNNDIVWEKTHNFGEKIFKISSGIILLGVFFPSSAFLFIILPTLLSSFLVIIYSCIEYNKLR